METETMSNWMKNSFLTGLASASCLLLVGLFVGGCLAAYVAWGLR